MNPNVSDRPVPSNAEFALVGAVQPRRLSPSRVMGRHLPVAVRRRQELNDDGDIATGFMFAVATASVVWAVIGAAVWAFV